MCLTADTEAGVGGNNDNAGGESQKAGRLWRQAEPLETCRRGAVPRWRKIHLNCNVSAPFAAALRSALGG